MTTPCDKDVVGKRRQQLNSGTRRARIYGEDYRILRPLCVQLTNFKAETGETWRLQQPTIELDVALPQHIADNNSSSSSSKVSPIATPTYGRPYVSYTLQTREQ